MTRASILNDALVTINNAEARGHRQVLIRPSSKVLIKYLSVMQRHGSSRLPFKRLANVLTGMCFLGYIGEFEIVDDHRSGKIVVQLNGRLNKTGVISPRYNVQANQIETWVNLLLPARGFGIIILVRPPLYFHVASRLIISALRRLRRVSLITRRHVVRTSVASFWAMFTRCMCIFHALCRSYLCPK